MSIPNPIHSTAIQTLELAQGRRHPRGYDQWDPILQTACETDDTTALMLELSKILLCT